MSSFIDYDDSQSQEENQDEEKGETDYFEDNVDSMTTGDLDEED